MQSNESEVNYYPDGYVAYKFDSLMSSHFILQVD